MEKSFRTTFLNSILYATFLFIFSSTPIFSQNNALDFKIGDYVEIPNPVGLAPTNSSSKTITFWAEGTGVVASIYENFNTASNFFIFLDQNSIQVAGNGVGTDGLEITVFNSSTPFSSCTHFAVILQSGINETKIYVNGVLVHSATLRYNDLQSDLNLWLGGLQEPRSDMNSFEGVIDRLKIYDGALSIEAISNDQCLDAGVEGSTLLASFNFNQGNAGNNNNGITTLPDNTGSFDGTLIGFDLSGSSSNWISSTYPSCNADCPAVISTPLPAVSKKGYFFLAIGLVIIMMLVIKNTL